MILWGLVAAPMSFDAEPTSSLSLRFLLGVAEAGFIPGIMLYASYWITGQRLGAFTSLMLLMVPIAGSVTALVSGLILSLGGVLGLAGWQWLLVLEGAPAILLGLYGLIYLPSRPRDATWLTEAKKVQVEDSTRLISGGSGATSHGLAGAFRNGRTWTFAVAYLFIWTLPTSTLRVDERPVGIALVTCVGLVGSFLTPTITSCLKEAAGSYQSGMFLTARVGAKASAAPLVSPSERRASKTDDQNAAKTRSPRLILMTLRRMT